MANQLWDEPEPPRGMVPWWTAPLLMGACLFSWWLIFRGVRAVLEWVS